LLAFAALVLVSSAQAQLPPPPQQQAMPVAPTPLYQDPGAYRDLNLTPEQYRMLVLQSERLQGRFYGEFNRLPSSREQDLRRQEQWQNYIAAEAAREQMREQYAQRMNQINAANAAMREEALRRYQVLQQQNVPAWNGGYYPAQQRILAETTGGAYPPTYP